MLNYFVEITNQHRQELWTCHEFLMTRLLDHLSATHLCQHSPTLKFRNTDEGLKAGVTSYPHRRLEVTRRVTHKRWRKALDRNSVFPPGKDLRSVISDSCRWVSQLGEWRDPEAVGKRKMRSKSRDKARKALSGLNYYFFSEG